jgi:hypothetical protein
MKYPYTLPFSAALLTGMAALPANAELTVTPYGSLRIQAEAVSVDEAQPGEDDSYTGLRDAYSRLGVNASYNDFDNVDITATLEFPINSARLRAEDPTFFHELYKEDNNSMPRVATISAAHDQFGSVTVGTQWLAYYNNVAYPVDFFSSFYSGFATQAAFRRDALTYTSPSMAGVTATVSGVDMTDEAGTSYLDTMQYALSWSADNLTLAAAYQDTEQDSGDRPDQVGASATYTTGPWRFAAKVEQLLSHSSVTVDEDPITYNLYGSYSWNKYTFKAMYAQGEETDGEGEAFFQGDSVHVGMDYQHTEALKFFAEYFYEELGYAIYTPNSDSFNPLAGYQVESDGQVFTVGLRYDF